MEGKQKKPEEVPVLPTTFAFLLEACERLPGNALTKVGILPRRDTFLTESLILKFLIYELWEKGHFGGRGVL